MRRGRIAGLDPDQSAKLVELIEQRALAFALLDWGGPTVVLHDDERNELFFWMAEPQRARLEDLARARRYTEEAATPSDQLEISTDLKRIDVAAVHRVIAASYWAPGRSLGVVRKSIENSFCFGPYHDAQRQIVS